MLKIDQFLVKKSTLLWLLIISIILAIIIYAIAQIWRISLLDCAITSSQVQAVINDLNDQQIIIHAWVSSTLDIIFPIVYGLFFIGCSLKAFPGRRYLIMPGILASSADIFEGIVQSLFLFDVINLLVLKVILTPIKFTFFLTGASISLLGCIILRKTKKELV
jgi:hypothetical protein